MDLTQQNIQEAMAALTDKPMLATSAERILILDEIKSSYHDLPQPMIFAKTLSTLLSRVSTPLQEYDLIAGRCVDRELTEEEEAIYRSFLKHPDYPYRRALLASGHCTYSWDMVVREGLPGLRATVVRRREAATDEDTAIFCDAILEIYDAIESYMLRYAEAAEAKGLLPLAERLRAAATEKPGSFAVALQLLWIITLICCAYVTPNPTLTVGRLDQVLYPLYEEDLRAGRLTKQEAAALVTDYYCKHNLIMGRGEHQVGDESNSTTFLRICAFDAPQYLLLSGRDEKGRIMSNELTHLFAECIVPAFKNPVVVVRYPKGLDQYDPILWKTLTAKAMQSASLMFYNDDNVTAAFHRLGLPMEDARQYIHFGCNWASPGDRGNRMQGGPRSFQYRAYLSQEEEKEICIPQMFMSCEHGWPQDLMIVLRQLADRDPESVSMEDVYRGFFGRMEAFLDRKLAHLSRELDIRHRRPSAVLTYADCFLKDPLERGQCISACAPYHFELQSFQMFGTVADCFIAIDQLVMRQKKLTLKELLAAVDADFVGHERVLALCRHAEKYGMDTPLSNQHVQRLSHTASDLAIEKCRPYFERQKLFLVPCMQSDTWHLKSGEAYGATPDGRRAGTPFSQNTRPTNGVCVNGMTAMFNAMLHLPQNGLVSGALNLDIDPAQFAGESGQAIFAALLAAYFNAGGLHAQVSAAGLDRLRDAQVHPQAHRDLRVRVTGYSGIFTDICPRLQADIIHRFE